MEELRNIFRVFCQKKKFDGWVIGKLCFGLEYQRHDASCSIITVQKQKKDYAVLEASSSELTIQMHILNPSSGLRGEKEFLMPEHSMWIASKTFSKEEILAFVEEVGDDNWIHWKKEPVVPGALMAEWLWESGLLRRNGERTLKRTAAEDMNFIVEFLFHAPVYAGEKMTVYRDNISGQMYSCVDRQGKRILLWKVRFV